MSENRISLPQVALTLTVSLASSLITFASTVATLDTERDIEAERAQQTLIERLEARVGTLHTDIDAAEKKYERLAERTDQCQARLDKVTLPPLDALKAALEALPGPAWIKRVVVDGDRVQFQMLMLNNAYERRYQVSEGFYRDKTDFDVWPKSVAQATYSEDLQVYQLHTRRRSTVALPENPHREAGPDNPLVATEIWRGVIRLPGGDWGVLGINTQPPLYGYRPPGGPRLALKDPRHATN